MPGLVPGIHVLCVARKVVDGRDKPGHDDVETPSAGSLHNAGDAALICPTRQINF
jgi:methylaspartate ammonia-lyase